MIVELLVDQGGQFPTPVKLPVSQILIRQDNGTLLMVAAQLPGPDNAQLVSKVGDADWKSVLHQLGIRETVTVQEVRTPAPGGARLWTGS